MAKLGFGQRRTLQEATRPCGGNNRQPEKQPAQRSRFLSPMSWDLAVHDFIARIVLHPYRWRRFRIWAISLYPRARGFVYAISGGQVSDTVRRDRAAVCEACETLQIQVPRTPRPYERWARYCGSCGCPKWRLSRLSFKNRLRRAYCPQRLHPGPYPDDWWRKQVEALEKSEEGHETG
jgi:hypothetical protein